MTREVFPGGSGARGGPFLTVALLADVFADREKVFHGGAERHMLQLARAMQMVGIRCLVYQAGPNVETFDVDGLEVRSRRVRVARLWADLAHAALKDGCTHLYVKYLEHVPAVLPATRVAATQHGVHWDIPFEEHGRRWYRGGAVARGYLPAWRAGQIGRSFLALRRCAAVSAMDTSFLRLVQALWPEYRQRLFVTAPFSDLAFRGPRPASLASLSAELARRVQAVREAGGTVVLVPRNLSLVRGESWLPEIFSRVATTQVVLFIVTGQFLGPLDRSWRAERLRAAVGGCGAAGDASSSLLHLGGCPHEAMPHLYQVADLVLIPTFAHEGASLAAAEAAAFGRPVVATNVGGLNDTLDDNWSAVVTRPDPASIAAAILRLGADPALRRFLGANARRRAAACFGLDRWRESQIPFFRAAGWLGG